LIDLLVFSVYFHKYCNISL